MEDGVKRPDEIFDMMLEARKVMTDNLVKLTEMLEQECQRDKERFEILLEEARADRVKMDRYFEENDRKLEEQRQETDRKLEQQRLQMEQQRQETDRK